MSLAEQELVAIHEKLNEIIEAQKDSPDPVELTKSEVKRLFEDCGVEEEKLETFDQLYDAAAGETTSLLVNNVANTRSFEVKTPDVVIKVNPERADLVTAMTVEGKRCLVIELSDQVEVNGIKVGGRTDGYPEELS